ncbi:hypothetical protein PS914_06275 [Pseudomonas fluorescens]|uniref:S-type pyocin domain-containing protein n=1 Tax=Pseudomonas fluorescens TaxID=294 RepID=UPI00125ABEE7|nr:S-type pyocin domain-containing protein [Pseudomonas fluorescens]VVQ19233.1 hypothetical protein PS914_06275 [Pseudomonas fluorescens]
MAQQTLNDGSTGDVVIRSGPPASGGGGGGGSGGGGSGGNRVGASGAFSGPSQSTKEARRRVKQEYLRAQEQQRIEAAAAEAQAQEHVRVQARQQVLESWMQRHHTFRTAVDQSFAAKASQLTSSLQDEILAAKRTPNNDSTERWQLYLITKEKNEIDGLIARKTSELNAKNASAHAFDGHNALVRSASDYLARLDQFGEALGTGHQIWENAYNAAHEANLLSAQINALTEKSTALSRHHAEQTIVWREREAVVAQRDAHIRFKQQADADSRIERVRQANTLTVPVTALAHGGMILSQEAVHVAQEVAAALEKAVQAAADTLIDVLRIGARTGPVFVTAMVYSPTLGNGELTPEQRRRLFHAVSVPAQALGLYDRQELQTIADAGGQAEVESRLKPVAIPEGAAIIAVSAGGDVDSRVPVINAVLDPLSGLYTAEIPGAPPRHLLITPDATLQPAMTNPSRLAVTPSEVLDIPSGVDLRIQDCIVCVPGLPPTYLSFSLPPMGAGVVTGTGHPATTGWWNSAPQAQGAAIPAQIGDQFRGREFKSFEAFDKAVWQTLGEHRLLAAAFDEVNKKRIDKASHPTRRKARGSVNTVSSSCAIRNGRSSGLILSTSTKSVSRHRIMPRAGSGSHLQWFLGLSHPPLAGNLWCRRAANTSGRRHRPSRRPCRWLIPVNRLSRSYRKTRRFRLLTNGRLVREFRGIRRMRIFLRPAWFSLARRLSR